MLSRMFVATILLAGVASMAEARAANLPVADNDRSVDQELIVRLDCLGNMPGLRPGIASRAFRPFLGETREWLAGTAAQDALLRVLPTLTTRQLVTLWDVLWFPTDPSPEAAWPKDMEAIAAGFAVRFNDAALSSLAAEKDALRRRLLTNMIKPQAHTMTKKQQAEFGKVEGAEKQ